VTTSQNGWPVSPANRTTLVVNGVSCGGVRSGDVFTVLQYVATRYDREVQRLKAGQCGGYNPRSIAGSGTPSNHASATANDFNWTENPEHKRTMTAAERSACHAIVRACDGVVRWGGDYSGSDVDEMHWEIIGNAHQVAMLAGMIQDGELMDDATILKIAKKVKELLDPQLDAAASAWDDTFNKEPNVTTAGARLAQVAQDTAAIRKAVVPEA
jgi:hypothetical protein